MHGNYFQTMRISLKYGRTFTDADRVDAPPVAILNETMARRYWPGENPVGRRILIDGSGGPERFEVVEKIGELMKNEPHVDIAELGKIRARSLVMFSDDDLVTLEHAVAMFDAIPGAEFAVVPGTSHFLTQEKPHLVNALVLDFLTNEPVPTVAPVRRARKEASPQP